MRVINENMKKVTIEFDKIDFDNIRNFFITNDKDTIKNLCSNESELASLSKLVYLDGVDKGVCDAIEVLLDDGTILM